MFSIRDAYKAFNVQKRLSSSYLTTHDNHISNSRKLGDLYRQWTTLVSSTLVSNLHTEPPSRDLDGRIAERTASKESASKGEDIVPKRCSAK